MPQAYYDALKAEITYEREETEKTLEQYLEDKNPEMVRIVRGLQKLVKLVEPGMKQSMNAWNVPVFEKSDGVFCLIMVAKAHVSFGFPKATSLPDPHGLLEGTGKNMRHVKLKSVGDLKREGLRELTAAAAKSAGGMRTRAAKGPTSKRA